MLLSNLNAFQRVKISKVLELTIFFLFCFILVSQEILSKGPLFKFDHYLQGKGYHHYKGFARELLLSLDRLGLRGLTAFILLTLSLLLAKGSWRPLKLSLLSLLMLNLVIGVAKLVFGRSKPSLGIDSFNAGGLSYPSGHAANAVVTWGLIFYFLSRQTKIKNFGLLRAQASALLIALIVCFVSQIGRAHV